RHIYIDLSVKTPCTHKRSIEDIRTVGSCENNNSAVCTKPIHLCKKLIKRVFTLVVSSHTRVFASSSTNRIYLIDKYNCRCFFFSLLEQITYTRCSNTYEHFYEVRS